MLLSLGTLSGGCCLSSPVASSLCRRPAVLAESDEAQPQVLLVGGEEGEELIVPCVAREAARRASVRHLVRASVKVRVGPRARVANPAPSQVASGAPPG